MVSDQTNPAAAAAPLTQNDRDMLAWYLARGLTPDNLKLDTVAAGDLRAWARSPRIAPHIEAFHEINADAEYIRRTRARIDGYAAVSDALFSATTVAEKLHAINALIRLNNSSCATGSRRLGGATSATSPTSAPDSSPSRRRDPYANFYLPPLPPLGPRPATAQSPAVPAQSAAPKPAPSSATAPGPNPGIAIPGSSTPAHSATCRPQTSPAPAATAAPLTRTHPAPTAPSAPSTPYSAPHTNGAPFPTSPSSSPSLTSSSSSSSSSSLSSSSLSSSSSSSSTRTVAHRREQSPARRLTEISGAATAGAWP